MAEQKLLERIALDPKVMIGKPIIRGTRLTVEYILNLLAHGTHPALLLSHHTDGTQKYPAGISCSSR